MRDFNIRKLQMKEMEILNEVNRICEEHNIKYYLTWGSALGAVRHKGFIPWDDDIDISMFWDDYVKFEEVCKEELDSKFFFQNVDTDKDNWVGWNRIRMNNTTSMYPDLNHMKCHWGICMDVFPIIAIPNSKFKRIMQDIKSRLYRFICFKPLVIKNPEKHSKAKYIVYRVLPDYLLSRLRKYCLKSITKYSIKENSMCGELLDLSYKKAITPKEIYGEPKFMVFENKKFPLPSQYDEYLTRAYGDYMKLPDECERVGHGNIIIDTENSYKRYTLV